MGERNSVFVFKGPTVGEFRDSAASIVSQFGGHLSWEAHPDPMSAKMLTSHNGNVHAAYIHVKGYEIAKAIGATLVIPWINVRIQEGALWDYSLYRGESNLDNFSTLPEYWGNDSDWERSQRGNPDILASVWGVKRSAVENYLKPWGFKLDEDSGFFETIRRGKANPSDQHEYGDIWQMTDFLRALGAHDPNWSEPHCVSRHISFGIGAKVMGAIGYFCVATARSLAGLSIISRD